MPFWAPDIGIDLGTENVSLYVRGRGVVISEPALVVLDREDRHTVQAVGDEAGFLLGRSPDRLTPVWPIRNGLVADFDIAELMLTFYSNQDYRIVVCADEFDDVQFRLVDLTGKELYSNTNHGNADHWDFSTNSTQLLTVEVSIPENKTSADTKSGCVSI